MLNVVIALVLIVGAFYAFNRLLSKNKYSPEIEAKELLAKAEEEAATIEQEVKTPLIK